MTFKSISKIIALIFILQSKTIGQQIKFTNIKLPDEIKSINGLLVNNGMLFIATAQGLYSYSDTTFYRFYEKNDEEAYRINALCPDRLGNLWFGTYNGLLVKFSGKKISSIFDIKPHCKTDNYLITSISIDTTIENKNSEILLSTSGGELFGYDTLKQSVRKFENPEKGTIFAIKYGYWPLKWLCSADGFFTMKKNMKWKKRADNFIIYQIAEYNGKYWGIGRDKNTKALFMLYYDDYGYNRRFKWKDFDLEQLKDKYTKFNELAIADDEIAWIASENGLIRYNPTNASLSLAGNADGVDLKALRHISIQSKDLIWVSSSGRRLIKVKIE